MALFTTRGDLVPLKDIYKLKVKIKYDELDDIDFSEFYIFLSYDEDDVEYLKSLKSITFDDYSMNIKSIIVNKYQITEEEYKYLKKNDLLSNRDDNNVFNLFKHGSHEKLKLNM